ncbi:MAG TPA: hypothetical protein VK753_02290 [Xanthomonadaceae bacterium]|jgi:hypothetical protein|nr:hypothetical protein [Xanthomonadaceae bacterium]
MTDRYQKDLDQAAKDRSEAQADAAKERLKAEDTFVKAEDKADRKFEKDADKAEAIAMNRDPITGSPGSHPIGTGVGTIGGMVAGAVVGSVVGPVGSAVGGVVGAMVGAAAGHSAGEAINPSAEETFWRGAYIKEPYYDKNYSYEDYAPAYRSSFLHRKNATGRTWDQAEPELKAEWESNKDARLRWFQVRNASRAAWNHASPGGQ